MTPFVRTQKQEQRLMKVTLMMYLNKSILQLYQIYEYIQKKVQARLLIQSYIIILTFQSTTLYLVAVIANCQKKLDHPRKGFINIQNIDYNECFKWCLVRHLHLADHHLARITKTDKYFARELDFKDIKFPVKTRDTYKIEKKRILSPLGFSVMKTRFLCYENKVFIWLL